MVGKYYIDVQDIEDIYKCNDWDPHEKHICLADLTQWKPFKRTLPHWIMSRRSLSGILIIRCSVCKKSTREPTEFCPACGEEMIGVNEYIYEEEKDI